MKRILVIILLAAWSVPAAHAGPLSLTGTHDLSPFGGGQAAFFRPLSLLLVTDGARGEVHLLRVRAWDPPEVDTVDAFPPSDTSAAVQTPGRPTSVAVHPRHPLALVTVASRLNETKGLILFLDLRERSPGRVLRSQAVGFAPESVAIAPDGQWAVVANQGQQDRAAPGSIGLLDLRNLEGWADDRLLPAPYREFDGLPDLLGVRREQVAPEFAAFAPSGEAAAVSLQGNDAVALLDFAADEPALAGVLRLPRGARPDGVSLLRDPADTSRLLLAVAEEGRSAQAVSLHALKPGDLAAPAERLARADVRPLANPDKPRKPRDPTGVLLIPSGRRVHLLATLRQGGRVLGFDVTDPRVLALTDRVPVGDRPEGLVAVEASPGWRIIAVNRGDDRPPGLAFLRLAP